MTGRMSSLHGARHNGIPLSRDHTTFVELLKDAGYATGLIGKSHLQSFTGLPATNQYTPIDGLHVPAPRLRDAYKNNRHTSDYDLEVVPKWDRPLKSSPSMSSPPGALSRCPVEVGGPGHPVAPRWGLPGAVWTPEFVENFGGPFSRVFFVRSRQLIFLVKI